MGAGLSEAAERHAPRLSEQRKHSDPGGVVSDLRGGVRSLPALFVPGLVRNRGSHSRLDEQTVVGQPRLEVLAPRRTLASSLRGSFGSFGALERVSTATGRRLPADLRAVLQVVEPPTPQRRCATDDDVANAYGFDFDELDALEEAEGNDSEDSTGPPLGSEVVEEEFREPPSAVLPRAPAESPRCETLARTPCERPPAPREAAPPGKLARSSSAPAAERSEGLRVAILANGSRGDVQPCVALALRLSRLRHRVRILTNADLVEFCQSHGVDAAPVFVSWSVVIAQIGGMSGSSVSARCVQCMRRGKTAAEEWLKANPSACRAAEDCLEEFQPDAVLCGVQSTGPALRFELGAGVPSIYTFLARDQLDMGAAFTQMEPARPSFLASSPVFEPLEKGKFSEDLHQSGPWILDDEPSSEDLGEGGRLERLQAFLASGEKPVAVGWGSMIAEGLPPAAMLGVALRALRESGRRGVVLGGWARLHELGEKLVADGYLADMVSKADVGDTYEATVELAEFAESSVLFIDEAPHGWLLPRCSCFVHHGGAGTTHAALRAGVPSVMTPIFGDQFAAAETLDALDAGAAFELPLQELSPSHLAKAIHLAEASAKQAAALGERLRAEDGARTAAAVLDRFLRSEVRTGRWAEELRRLRAAPEAKRRRGEAPRSAPTAAGPPVSPARERCGAAHRDRTPTPFSPGVRRPGWRAAVRGASPR